MGRTGSEHVIKFIADISQVGVAFKQLEAEAAAASSRAVSVPKGQKRTPLQRQTALSEAQGRSRAATSYAYETGRLGPVGSDEAKKLKESIQRRQNTIFRTAREDAGLSKAVANSPEQVAIFKAAEKEQLNWYRRTTTERQRQILLEGDITKAKQLIVKNEFKRGIITEQQLKAELEAIAKEKAAAKSVPTPAKAPRKSTKSTKKTPVVEPPVVDQAQLDADAGAAAAIEDQKRKKRVPKVTPEVVKPQKPVQDFVDEDSIYNDKHFGPRARALDQEIEANDLAGIKAQEESLAAMEAGNEAALKDAALRDDLAQVRADELQLARDDLTGEYYRTRDAETRDARAAKGVGAIDTKASTVIDTTATEKKKPSRPKKRKVETNDDFFDENMSDEEIDAALLAQAKANAELVNAIEGETVATADETVATGESTVVKKRRTKKKKARTAEQIVEDESLVVRVSPEEVAARTSPENLKRKQSPKPRRPLAPTEKAERDAYAATARATKAQEETLRAQIAEAEARRSVISTGKDLPLEIRAANIRERNILDERLKTLNLTLDETMKERADLALRERNRRRRQQAAYDKTPEGQARIAARYAETPEAKASAARREEIVTRTPAAELVANQKAEAAAADEARKIEEATTVAKAQLAAEQLAAGRTTVEYTEAELQARMESVRVEQERARLKRVLTPEQAKRIAEDSASGDKFVPNAKTDVARLTAQKQAEQRAAIARDDILLKNPVRDTSALSFIEGQKVRKAQQAQFRAIGKRTAAEEAAAAQVELGLVEEKLADRAGLEATIALAAAKKRYSAVVNAGVETTLLTDAEYVAAVREAAAVKQKSVLADLEYQAASATFIPNEAAINVQKAAINEQRLAIEYELLLADEGALKEKARGLVLQEKYNRALNAEVRAQAKAAGLNRGGLLQRIKDYAHGGGGGGGGGGRGLGSGETGGQFLAGGGLSTLKHVLPALVLFAAAGGILASVKAAEDLERELALVQAQFEATDQAADFPIFRQSILDIARDTGVAADVVAHLGLQIQGAFGQGTGANIGGLGGLDLVQSQLDSAAQIAQVTGLDPKEIVDSLTAASFAFDESFSRIGDVTLSLQDRFGVLAKEIIPSLGDIAPVAAQAGFSLEEFGTIAAAAQQRSGRSGTALIENFNRIIPAVGEAKLQLLGLAQNVEALRTPAFLEAVGSGDVKTQLLEIARVYSQLTKPQRDEITQLLGGERNASALIAALANSDELMSQIRDTQQDTNGLAEHWADLQDTLAVKLDKLKEKFKQLGVALFEGGVGDILKLLVTGLGDVADITVELLDLFSSFNSALGGVPAKLLAVLAVLKLIQITNNKLNLGAAASGLVTGVQSRFASFGTGGAGGLATLSGRPPINNPGGVGFRQGVNSIGGTAAASLAAVSLLQLQQTREQVGADLSRQGQEIQELLQDKTEEEVAAFIEQRNTFSDQIQTDGYAAFFGAWVSGAKTLRQQAVDAQQEQQSGALLAALKAVKDAGVQGGTVQNVDRLSFPGSGLLSGVFDQSTLGLAGINNPLQTQVAATVGEANAELDQLIASYEADPTNDATRAAVDDYLANTSKLSDTQKKLIEDTIENYRQEAESTQLQQDVNEKRAERVDRAQLSLETLKTMYAAGAASFTELKQAYHEYTTLLQQTAAAGDNPDLALAAVQAAAEEQKFVSDAMRSTTDFNNTLASATGANGGGTERNQIASLISLLNNSDFSDAGDRRQAALDIVELEQSIINKEAEAADSAAEALRILTTGRATPEPVRLEVIKAQLEGNGVFTTFTDALATTAGLGLDNITDAVSEVILETGASVQEATLVVIEASIARTIEKISALGALNKGNVDAFANLNTILQGLYTARNNARSALGGAGSVDSAATIQAEADAVSAAQDKAEEEAYALQDAQSALFAAIHAGDPVALAQQAIRDADRHYAQAKTDADRVNAVAEKVAAQQALEDALNAVADARSDLFLASVENDPVAVARNAQQEADKQFARAKGEADRLSAQAARIRADRAVADAIQDIYASQADLLQAMFEYGGNTVQSAKLGLKTAKDRLAYLQSSGAGDAAINRAKGDVITAQGGLRDARLDRKLQDYAFLYDMDKINKQQYIAYLMQLKEIPDLTTQQLRDLDRQIKSLRDELGADFQFNLPTTLGLPTLYEVRRTNQTPGGGGSYQDMRNYNIVLYVNNGMDQAAAEQFLSEAMGTNRMSTGTRRY